MQGRLPQKYLHTLAPLARLVIANRGVIGAGTHVFIIAC